jgi:ubiquinone/menaquinone biosynthesis C-methylase UbiE
MADHILEFWNQQAMMHGQSHAASWGDNWAISLEVDTIGKYIASGDRVLDVGCANGYSTFHQLARNPASVTGVDFSPEMIQAARIALAQRGDHPNVEFREGDVRSFDFGDESFDVVYTTRVLINLPTWQEQMQGIDECLRVCRKGGTVVLCEAFWEPLVLLNAMRALKSLPSLVEHDFNRYIKQVKLRDFLGRRGLSFELIDFSSIYYLGSRFLRELVTNPEDYPGYSNPINELFFKIEQQYSGGGFGIQQACVIRKS